MCSSVQYEKECITPLKYKLAVNTPFTLMNIIDAPKSFIIDKKLKAIIAFQENPEEGNTESSSIHQYETGYINSDYIQLLGPVLFYQKSPINPFDNSVIFFYGELNHRHAWFTSHELNVLSYNFNNSINKNNQSIIHREVIQPILLENKLSC